MTTGFVEPSQGYQAPLDPVTFKPVSLSLTPRFVAKIDGNVYLGESYECTQNAHGATDYATITLPIDGWANFSVMPQGRKGLYPDWTVSIQRSIEAGTANTPVIAEIWAGFPPDPTQFGPGNLSGLQLRFRGVVDQYSVALQDNRTTFSCRSLAFPLASTKITVPFPDEASVTTVAFIKQMCARFNIPMAAPNLGRPPVRMIDVLGGEFITGVRAKYVWDLMIQCALFDDVDVWVDNAGTLHYEAASLIERPKVYYQWGSNCKGLEGTHSPQFSKNIRVYVHSWVPRTRTTSTTRVTTNPDGGATQESYSRVVNATPIFGTTESVTTSYNPDGTVSTSLSQSGGGGASGGTGELNESGLEKYYYFPKNKTLAQCEVIAQQRWRQISMHEYSIKLQAPVTPGNLKVMGVTAAIVLSGHPMAMFNSVENDNGQPWSPLVMSGGYWPRQIVERFDPKSSDGWDWTIDAVNHPLPQGAV